MAAKVVSRNGTTVVVDVARRREPLRDVSVPFRTRLRALVAKCLFDVRPGEKAPTVVGPGGDHVRLLPGERGKIRCPPGIGEGGSLEEKCGAEDREPLLDAAHPDAERGDGVGARAVGAGDASRLGDARDHLACGWGSLGGFGLGVVG